MKELCEYIEGTITYECMSREFLVCSGFVLLGCSYVLLSGGIYAG